MGREEVTTKSPAKFSFHFDTNPKQPLPTVTPSRPREQVTTEPVSDYYDEYYEEGEYYDEGEEYGDGDEYEYYEEDEETNVDDGFSQPLREEEPVTKHNFDPEKKKKLTEWQSK